jgi:predicted PurR-regulated permease PerM
VHHVERSPGSRAGVTLAQASVVVALVLAVVVVWYARDVLLLGFAGVLLAVFFRRLACFIHDRSGIPTSASLAIVVLLLFGGLGVLFWLRGPAIAAEFDQLREGVPRAAETAKARLQDHEWGRAFLEKLPSMEEMLPDAQSTVSRATGVVSRTFGALTTFVIILFLGIAFAASPQPYISGILAVVPANKVERLHEVLRRVEQTLWWWLLGRIFSMMVIGVATGAGLWLLGIPLAFTLAVIAALLTFIPNIGPIIAALPAVLLALAQSPRLALYVVLLYSGVQAVETYVLGPVVDKKTVALPPALTVLAQLLLVTVAGLIGAALAAPLVAALVVTVTMLYVHDVLGRRDVAVPGNQ